MREFLIVTGPLDQASRLRDNQIERPRLDVDKVAEACDGRIIELFPSSGGLRGPRLVNTVRSLVTNTVFAVQFVRGLSPEAIVYSTGETWGFPIAIVRWLTGKRFAHIIYVHRVYSPLWQLFLQAFHRALKVDGWICVTKHQEHLLQRWLGPDARITAISQGVDTDFWDPSKAKSNGGEPYILSVGTEMRDYALLFEAVKDLDVRVIVKASSAWMERTRHKVPPPPPNVEIITRRLSYVELRDLYAGAALVVVPLYDTVQAAGITTILEAMAMGKCVVATESRGLPDVLCDDNGIVARTESIQLREVLLMARKVPSMYAEIAAASRVASETVSIERHSEYVSTFCKEIVTHVR